jgi:hypothetical protein
MRSGEGSAAGRVAPHLAPDVVCVAGATELLGDDAVLAHVTGIWPNTPIYQMGGWSEPALQGDQAVVQAEFPAFGSGLAALTVTFDFDDADRIVRVVEEPHNNPRPEPTKQIPLVARALINSALANGTPIVVAYVNEEGEAQLSLRGSTQVYSPTQISIWLRSAEGGLPRAMSTNPKLTLLYRDSKSRTTLIVKGNGRIATDEATRNRVFELSPEVEQLHDPDRTGAALIIDVRELRGGTAKGAVNVAP